MRIPKCRYIFETTVDTGSLAGIVKGKQVVVIKPGKVDLSSFIIIGQVLIACIIYLCVLWYRHSRAGNSDQHP